MPLQSHGSAPYTTGTAAVSSIAAFRDRGLGTPITAEVLTRAGVPESIANRTLSSLKLLDLIEDNGEPTQQFKDMRLARGDEEFQGRLQEWLRAVYAEVLLYTDPSVDLPDRVAEAFRSYEPAGQRRAMASLLIGLWKFAGLPVPAESGALPARRPTSGLRTKARRKAPDIGTAVPVTPSRRAPVVPTPAGDLPPGLVGLLHQIPRSGESWTSIQRDGFLRAFEAVLNYTVTVDDSPAPPAGDEDEDDDEG